MAWSHTPRPGDTEPGVVLSRSTDEGRLWTPPQTFLSRAGYYAMPTSLFVHRDGSISCLIIYAESEASGTVTLVLRSEDGGDTWADEGELSVGGRPLSSIPYAHPYSPMQRLSDGTVVMCAYEADTSRGDDNSRRQDRSLFLRSEDDGRTWDEPIYLEPENFDHNECTVSEVEPGRLVAFMRTLRATCMWTSTSADGGRTWTKLTQSDISAECPCLLAHSSGPWCWAAGGTAPFCA